MGISIAGLAAAGAADQLIQYNNKYIDQNLAIQRAQALADIGRNSAVLQQQQMFDQEHRQQPTKLADTLAANTAITLNQGDNASQVTIDNANDPELQAANATIAQANAANTPQKLTPGEQVFVGGKPIASNANLTNADVNKMAYTEGMKGNLGKPGPQTRADHFTDKEWKDAAEKLTPAVVGFQDPMGGGKPVESGDLVTAREAIFNALRAQGDYDPQTATAMANQRTNDIKNKAIQMAADAKAADKKSTLTEADAARIIVQQIQAAAQKAAAAVKAPPVPAAAPATVSAPPAQGTPLQSLAGAAGAQARQAPPAASPEMQGMSSMQLDGIANGRYSPAMKAAAAAELARRSAAHLTPSNDAQFDPSNYTQ